MGIGEGGDESTPIPGYEGFINRDFGASYNYTNPVTHIGGAGIRVKMRKDEFEAMERSIRSTMRSVARAVGAEAHVKYVKISGNLEHEKRGFAEFSYELVKAARKERVLGSLIYVGEKASCLVQPQNKSKGNKVLSK